MQKGLFSSLGREKTNHTVMGTFEKKAPHNLDMKLLQDYKQRFFLHDSSSMTVDTQNDAEFEEFMVVHQ